MAIVEVVVVAGDSSGGGVRLDTEYPIPLAGGQANSEMCVCVICSNDPDRLPTHSGAIIAPTSGDSIPSISSTKGQLQQ